ncbi:Glycosyl transferase family 2 [Aquisphaera giovannonii]|uniref:Glycosyl transferase family 2 n=1 Tax=Aquisphaera giovannonii TaxID=406548 RepID=A0A5B9WA45_9BACT|nr:glycosyltransferase [Aquisphaera giovannonii]QEH37134.1 Glycosyl transferase family 2 [Aquisphaera giovannonii]
MNERGQTVCLNMIVKDEAHVIRRCLESARPLIDAWVISDTGSTDGTQNIIREVLADIPGTLIERPWVDFAHNRTEVLEASRGRADYILVVDADDEFEVDDSFVMPALAADSYNVALRFGGMGYHRRQMVRSALPWRYEGVLHEYLTCEQARTEEMLNGVRILVHHEGARSRDPLTYRRDALVLEKALLDEPDNARYVFYLAQSYRDAQDPELALRHYRRRAAMGGWRDEAWYSLYRIAHIESQFNKPWTEVMASYLTAFQYMPSRAEPLYWIAMHYQRGREFHVAKGFFEWAMAIPSPTPTALFVERSIYEYLLELEYAVSCYYVGEHAKAVAVNDRLLARGTLPADLVHRVAANRQFSRDVLAGQAVAPAAPGRWATETQAATLMTSPV